MTASEKVKQANLKTVRDMKRSIEKAMEMYTKSVGVNARLEWRRKIDDMIEQSRQVIESRGEEFDLERMMSD